MAFHEKSSWVALIVAVPTLLIYLAAVVPQVLGTPVSEISWVGPMAFAMAGFVVANVLGNVVAAFTNPREADKADQRDREIHQHGARFGNWLVIAGAGTALILAMAGADRFWIANAIYAGGMGGSVLSAVVSIAAYRGPFQGW